MVATHLGERQNNVGIGAPIPILGRKSFGVVDGDKEYALGNRIWKTSIVSVIINNYFKEPTSEGSSAEHLLQV